MSFVKAVAAGGKVRTKKVNKEKYQRTCELDGKIFKDRVRKLKHPRRK